MATAKRFVLPDKDGWNTEAVTPYDAAMAAYLGLIFDPTRAVIDVGANVGKIAYFLATRTTAQVICFEPAPSTYQALMANVASQTNIKVERTALSDRAGLKAFVGDGTVTGHLTDGKSGKMVSVPVRTLDKAIDPALDVGLIKIDVEGEESRVLAGAVETIRKWRPLLVIEVIDAHLRRAGASRAQLFALLAKLGYARAVNRFGMSETVARPTGASDVFFLPEGWLAPRLYLAYRKAGIVEGE